VELSSGAIRNHRPEIMFKAFEIVGYSREVRRPRFRRHDQRVPLRRTAPWRLIAAGIDRIVMLLAGAENIREVIMFPMNQQAQDLMMGAPARPTNAQLRELGIRVVEGD
jgi:aspartyl-tRNA synthetase